MTRERMNLRETSHAETDKLNYLFAHRYFDKKRRIIHLNFNIFFNIPFFSEKGSCWNEHDESSPSQIIRTNVAHMICHRRRWNIIMHSPF